MSTIYQVIEDLVGTVPEGLEPVAWIASVVILLFTVSSCYRIVLSIFGWMDR